jgi:iron complex outermembrane receptor protein
MALAAAAVTLAARAPGVAEGQETSDDVAAEAAGRVPVETMALDDLLDLESSVATKQQMKIERTPATVSVVTDDQIRDYGWNSINDVLAQLPGYARGQDFERRVITTRGNPETWNSDRTLLLLDGVPFNDVEADAALTWEVTSLAFFKKVDVLRGPASAVYGGNALSGAVGLETMTVDDLDGGGLRAALKVAPGTSSLSVFGGQRTEWVDMVAGAAAYHRYDGGYMDYDGSLRTTADGELARFRVSDHPRFAHLMTKLDGRAGLSGLSLAVHTQDSTVQTGYGWYQHIPDTTEHVDENRIYSDLRYRHQVGPVALDHVLQWQRHYFDADVRLYEGGALDGTYPNGVTEQVAAALHRGLARSQATLDLGRRATFLAGAEYSITLYGGDEFHRANADLVGDGSQLDGFRDFGPNYEPILDRPLHRMAGFAQLTSGDWLGRRLELTGGMRIDGMMVDYLPAGATDGRTRSDSYTEFSPRLGVVAQPADWLTLKAMAGRAFRPPAVIELFAANTWTTGSNPENLRPERDTSYELAMEIEPASGLRWRTSGFYSRRTNFISYAAGYSDVLVNLYSNDRIGFESELVGAVPLGPGRLEGHSSVSYVRLVDEESLHEQIAASDELDDAPELLVKAGARWIGGRATLSAQAYAQGPTRRRDSAMMTPEFRAVRPDQVPAHMTVDASAFYDLSGGLRLGATASNLFDRRARLIAPYDVGNDYHVDPRRVFLVLELTR